MTAALPLPDPVAMRGKRRLRILHCPWNVAGQSAQLAAAERALGADSRCIALEETAFGFPADEVLVKKGAGIVAREIARWRLLWQAIYWADVVHFSFGQSCLVPHAFPNLLDINWRNPLSVIWRLYCRAIWLKDLPVLSAMGKSLAVTWQGDDARQHARSLEMFDISIAKALGDSYYVAGSDEWKKRSIATFARYVPVHYALNPDLLHVLPAQAHFLPYASLNPVNVQPHPPDAEGTHPLIFAHAPSHRGAKGTEHILAASEILKAEGLDFDLRLIEGQSRADAMLAYAECDVMIDQLLAGWYGGLGLEAMALGKPVIAYLRDSDLAALDPAMIAELPVINANPTTITDVMRRMMIMPRKQLHALGVSSRKFANHWHNPAMLAKRTLSDYQRGLSE